MPAGRQSLMDTDKLLRVIYPSSIGHAQGFMHSSAWQQQFDAVTWKHSLNHKTINKSIKTSQTATHTIHRLKYPGFSSPVMCLVHFRHFK